MIWRAVVAAIFWTPWRTKSRNPTKPDLDLILWDGVAASRTLTRETILAVAIVATATVATVLLRDTLAPTNLAMIYLGGVVAVAMRCSRRISVISSFLSVAAFDFFCVPPYLTFAVSDYQYVLTFAGMLIVALVISTQTVRLREHAAHAAAAQARTEALYRLSSRLAGETRVFEAARAATALAEEVFGARAVMFLPEDGRLSFRRRTSDVLPVPPSEESIAQWVFDNGHKAGLRTGTFPDATALYLPLRGARETFGVLAVLPDVALNVEGRIFAPEQQHLLEVFAGQTALAIERTMSQRAAEETRFHMQTEQMRSSLLSAVSHDLRTPLASITGAASTLRSQGGRLPPETRDELLESISDEADRLSRLVGNLLDMTRLESGGVELRRDFYPLEEIVGTALQRMESQLEGRTVITELAENLPMVFVDDVLLGQVLWNLLENIVKYTPSGTPIELAAFEKDGAVILEVRDRGPGVPAGEEERIFEKFYRGQSGNVSDNVRGAGLGLPICRAIIEAHRGTIQALPRDGGGSIFLIRLPLESRK